MLGSEAKLHDKGRGGQLAGETGRMAASDGTGGGSGSLDLPVALLPVSSFSSVTQLSTAWSSEGRSSLFTI